MPDSTPRPVMLAILDGWGLRDEVADNAVQQARTPIFDGLMRDRPRAQLRTSCGDVGLPEGQMGNSEVGHLNIGAGRVVLQDLPRIDSAIADGSLAKNPALLRFIDALRASGGTCHLVGLLSPGGVHAHQGHAVALARRLVAAGVPVRLHGFTDGRDMPPRSAATCVATVEAALPSGARIGTLCGRYYAMDRDTRWERVQIAYDALTAARGTRFSRAGQAVAASYADDVSDEFMRPAVIGDYAGMRDGDGVLCFNFRADRTRQILEALLDPAFAGFPRDRTVRFAAALGIVQYSVEIDAFTETLFGPLDLPNGLGETVARAGRRQLRMAETEKYPHVTYFMNGGLIDLDRLAPAVRETGAALVIDATQAVGAMPVDVARWRPDFLAFPTYKWALGPYGVAFLYAAPGRQDGVPIEEHAGNRSPAAGARRYDRGELNDPVALSMAAAGLDLIAGWGVPAVAARLRELIDRLAESVVDLGLAVEPGPLRAGHILGARVPGGLPGNLVTRLQEANVFVSERSGALRLSPHVWADAEDVARCVSALGRALGRGTGDRTDARG